MTRSCFSFAVCAFVAGASLGVGACSASSNGGFAPDDPSSSSSSVASSGSASGTGSTSGSASTSGGGSSGSQSSSSGGATSGAAGASSSGTAHSSSGGSNSTSSGSSSGGHASSSGSASSSGAALDASIDVAPPPPYDGGPQQCGSTTCDLKTSTCCVDSNGGGTCVAHGASCPALTAGFSCLASIDCSGSGMVCCGVATTLSANTMCQSVASGQSCSPSAANATMGSAQLCISSAECTMGQQCIAQTCLKGSNLRLCGLHDGPPFNCTAM